MSDLDPARQMTKNAHQDQMALGRRRRPHARLAVPGAVAAAGLLVGAVVALPPGGSEAFAQAGALKPFGSCDSVLQYFKDQAPDYLIERAGGDAMAGTVDIASGRSGADSSGAAEAQPAESPAYSTTNVHVAGVDEPDVVKTDGQHIVAVAQGRVHLVGLDDGTMTRRATLPDTGVRNVFLAGQRVLVFSGSGAQEWEREPGWPGQQAVLSMYDISTFSAPRLVATLTLDGDVVDARLVGTQVRVATVSSPDVDAPSPVYTPSGRISEKSKDKLRAAVTESEIEDWIPTYTLHDGTGAQVSKGRLVECADLARPETFAGLDTVALASFDMESGLTSRGTVGVIAGGQQLYATDASTYVATTEWSRDGSPATTSLHKFVTAPSGDSTYTGSGAVPGTLLNQYAMSEHQGVLRVATTVSERRGWVNSRDVTEGLVTTLEEHDGVLRQLGQVGGLGRQDNESIKAVRFVEERGYVVTFRQTDPLYVLDLRNPAVPVVSGELKIPGYSGYLHPIGKDRLLGVGQSGSDPATASSRFEAAKSGVQFSLFDISDPTSPRRIDTQTYGAGYAAAEFDAKAFVYWQPRDLIIAPMSLHGNHRGKGAFNGLVLLQAGADKLQQLGRLGSSDADSPVSRSLVIGDAVYMLTDHSLQANDLETLRTIDTLALS